MTGMMSVMPVIVCFHGMVTMAARVALGDSHMNGIPNISRRTTWWISSNTKPNPKPICPLTSQDQQVHRQAQNLLFSSTYGISPKFRKKVHRP
jgi:hypothetical protein